MGGKVIAGILAVVVLIGIFAVVKVAGGPEDAAPVAAVTEDEEEPEQMTDEEIEEVAEEVTTEEEAPAETDIEAPEPPPEEPPVREEPSAEEQLASLVAERVGPYRLAQAEVSEDFAVQTGATSAIFAGYASRGGGVVFHVLAAYPTSDKANQLLKRAAKAGIRDGARLVDVGPVKVEGRRTGTWVLLQGKTQSIVWTNGALLAVADGEHPHPIRFFSNVSY